MLGALFSSPSQFPSDIKLQEHFKGEGKEGLNRDRLSYAALSKNPGILVAYSNKGLVLALVTCCSSSGGSSALCCSLSRTQAERSVTKGNKAPF